MTWLARTTCRFLRVKPAMLNQRPASDQSGRAFPLLYRQSLGVITTSAIAILVGAVPAIAHEFYLQPSRYLVTPGEPVAITLGVGHAFEGDPLPYSRSHAARFFAQSSDGDVVKIAGIEGAHPAGVTRLPLGTWSLLYQGNPWTQTLSKDALRTHFTEVGRSGLLATAPQREVRERVYRCARALITTTDRRKKLTAPIDWSGQRTGDCSFELVPIQQSQTSLRVALLRNGKPVPGQQVSISAPGKGSSHSHGGGKAHHHRRTVNKTTDKGGAFTVDLAGTPGDWLVTAVQVEAVVKGDVDAQAGADYRSHWASISFHTDHHRPTAEVTDDR